MFTTSMVYINSTTLESRQNRRVVRAPPLGLKMDEQAVITIHSTLRSAATSYFNS